MVAVSIIIPVYNGEKYLDKCLKSIINQSLNDLEVICVDDGSTDDSLTIMEKYNSKYNNINIISQENQGSGKARNNGIGNSKGEFIAFLDADDIFLDNNALEEMYKIGIENDANVVSANLQLIDENYKIKKTFAIRSDPPKLKKYDAITPEEYGIPHAFYKNIYKRDFLINNDIQFPDLIRGQDPVFLAKVLINTNTIYTAPLNLYGYNYAIDGGINNKINNYKKKYSYLKHFKLTFDLLEKGNMINQSNKYKKQLLAFIVWENNLYDKELYEIYGDLFGKVNDNFDKTNKDYIMFKTLSTIYYLLDSSSEEYFNEVKNEFSEIDLNNLALKDKLIMKYKYKSFDEYKEKINLIRESKSLADFKEKYLEIMPP